MNMVPDDGKLWGWNDPGSTSTSTGSDMRQGLAAKNILLGAPPRPQHLAVSGHLSFGNSKNQNS
jgi:hypothetical protein